jgi:hypothetical protein
VTSTIQNLREVARRCQSGETLPPALSAWLAQSLDQFLSHRRRTIDDAFGLHRARGGIPWWMEEAIRCRDAALRELACRFYPNLSVSAQAREIHRLALRYASCAWPRHRSTLTLPSGYQGSCQEWLWTAFMSGAPMPIGERQLRHVLGASVRRPRSVAEVVNVEPVALRSPSQCRSHG